MNKDKSKKPFVMLTAGGTGGHIYPAEALAQELIKRGYDVEFATDSRGKGNYHGALGSVKNYALLSGALVGKSKLFKIKSLFKTGLGVLQACFLMLKKRPDCVVGFGGYASFPCSVAAILLGIDLVLHEQNSVMSRTNRLLGKYATIIAKSFENVKFLPENKKIIYTGMPVREQIVKLYKENRKITDDDFKILVLGGSQGAKVFADVVPEAIKNLNEKSTKRIKVVQQCRQEDEERISAEYEAAEIDHEVGHFFGNMDELYRTSDVIISRAGASSVCEILVAGIPSILVPLPIAADNHQYYNAMNIVDKNAGILLEQNDFTPQKVEDLLYNLMLDDSVLNMLSEKAKEIAIADASVRFADAIKTEILDKVEK